MRIPETPPDWHNILTKMLREKGNVVFTPEVGPTDAKGRYLHWDELKHREPPKGYSIEEWWAITKLFRHKLIKIPGFIAKENLAFVFCTPDCVLKELLWVDQNAAGRINFANQRPDHQMGIQHIVNSFIEEAISSSQMEGATTTRKIAHEMLRQGRKPLDKSELMIFNNYHAMEYIKKNKENELSSAMIFELHSILTNGTLDNQRAEGKYRTSDDIFVSDPFDGTPVYFPPKAEQLSERMERLCKFANERESTYFLHPVIRAIILHFMLAYDHPFEDGNGRTARALFYWSMLKSGYWLAEYISISTQIKKAQSQYSRSFLQTETDGNDLTYFIIHQLSVMREAIEEIGKYLERKEKEGQEALKLLQSNPKLRAKLNLRQLSSLRHALKNPGFIYTILGHKNTWQISYQTARNDLFALSDNLKLLVKDKMGKHYIFVSPADLNHRMKLG